jgi:hypothetical protein
MPLYEMTSDAFRPIDEASFADLKVRERGDLQRLLRSQIDVIGKEICDAAVSDNQSSLFLLTEEFCDWEESKRRIDLLALDRDAKLVVIELKRTGDGGHMELQAIRYAAMVSKNVSSNSKSTDFKQVGRACERRFSRGLRHLRHGSVPQYSSENEFEDCL